MPLNAQLQHIVPAGQCDRSLARSAWESASQKNRPVGYGMIGVHLVPEVFLVVIDHFLNLRDDSGWGRFRLGTDP